MSRLTISDLSFCETQLTNTSQIKGGARATRYSFSTATYSGNGDSNKDYADYFIGEGDFNFGYLVLDPDGISVGGITISVDDADTTYAMSLFAAMIQPFFNFL